MKYTDPFSIHPIVRRLDLIRLHRKNRVKPKLQVGRKLLRRHRWRIERMKVCMRSDWCIATRNDRLAIRFLG